MKNKIVELIKRIDWKAISPSTYIRYILMILTIVNTILTRCGLNPIDVSAEEIYQTISDIVTLVVLVINTWKNNSVTSEAICADLYMKDLKQQATNDNEAEG